MLFRAPLFVLISLAISTVLEPAPAQAIEVTGRVVNRERVPLAGARVFLSREVDEYAAKLLELAGKSRPVVARARSDSGGMFRLSVPEPGFWRLTADAKGHLATDISLVPILEDRELGDVRLDAASITVVTVQGPDGAALEGAWVAARHPYRRSRWAFRGLTDDRGQVRIPFGQGMPAVNAAAEVLVFASGTGFGPGALPTPGGRHGVLHRHRARSGHSEQNVRRRC